MCFSASPQRPPTLPSADAVKAKVSHSEQLVPTPPPSTFQRKCKTQGRPTNVFNGNTAEKVVLKHCISHDSHTRHEKDPIFKADLCPAHAGVYTIEESVQLFEHMLDVASEYLDTA
jgi:hypothetical protein